MELFFVLLVIAVRPCWMMSQPPPGKLAALLDRPGFGPKKAVAQPEGGGVIFHASMKLLVRMPEPGNLNCRSDRETTLPNLYEITINIELKSYLPYILAIMHSSQIQRAVRENDRSPHRFSRSIIFEARSAAQCWPRAGYNIDIPGAHS
jgi:hypothetical protein